MNELKKLREKYAKRDGCGVTLCGCDVMALCDCVEGLVDVVRTAQRKVGDGDAANQLEAELFWVLRLLP